MTETKSTMYRQKQIASTQPSKIKNKIITAKDSDFVFSVIFVDAFILHRKTFHCC